MSEQESDPKEVKETPFPLLEGMGEAGGIAFTTLRHYRTTEDGAREVLEISLTGRGRNAQEAFTNLTSALRAEMDKGWVVYKPTSELPRHRQELKAPPAGVKATVQPPTSGSAVPPINKSPDQPPVGGIINAKKLTITPRHDEKIALAFFAEGHKWADIIKVCSVEQAILTLSPIGGFTPDNFLKVEEYEITAEVHWANSEKLNTKGVPYKNIVEIRA